MEKHDDLPGAGPPTRLELPSPASRRGQNPSPQFARPFGGPVSAARIHHQDFRTRISAWGCARIRAWIDAQIAPPNRGSRGGADIPTHYARDGPRNLLDLVEHRNDHRDFHPSTLARPHSALKASPGD